MSKQKQGEYYTESGIDITERVNTGRTVFVKYKSTAEEKALLHKSYIFEVYDGADRNGKFIGYGIPKYKNSL